jgi:hypothetical protein
MRRAWEKARRAGTCAWLVAMLSGSPTAKANEGKPLPLPRGIAEAASTDPLPVETSLFRELKVEPRRGTLAGGRFQLQSPVAADPLGALIGLQRAGRPEDANLKAGPFYLWLRSISASVFYTDNAESSATEQRSETTSALRLGATAYLQIAERLRFAAAGSLVYLPQTTSLGLSGFGINDPLNDFLQGPLFRSQLVFSGPSRLSSWDLQWYNDLSASTLPFLISRDRFGLDEERSARGSFRDPQVESTVLVLNNRTGVSAEKAILPAVNLTIGVSRSYFWYDGDFSRSLPRRSTAAFVSIASQRENARVRPFSYYRADRYGAGGWTHRSGAGADSILSDYLLLSSEVSRFWSDESDRRGWLWQTRLRHQPTSLASQEIGYARSLTDPLRDLERTWFYRLDLRVNSFLRARVGAEKSDFEATIRPISKGRQISYVASLQADVIAQGALGLTGRNDRTRYEQPAGQSRDSYSLSIWARHRTLRADLNFNRVMRDSDRPSGYREDRILLTLTKDL